MKRFLLFALLSSQAMAAGTVVRTIGNVVATKTSSYVITAADGISYLKASGSGTIITLPAPGSNLGRQITIERDDPTNNICLAFNNASDTVDGVAYTTNFCLNDDDKITLAAFAANQWKVVSYQSPSPTMGQNYVIGGGFEFMQRGNVAVSTSDAYVFDRFAAKKSGTCTGATSNGSSGGLRTGARTRFIGQLTFTSSACNWIYIQHRLEAIEVRKLIGKTVTIGFWMHITTLSGLDPTGAVTFADAAPSAIDNWASYTTNVTKTWLPAEFTAATWKYLTYTFTVPTTVGANATSNGYGFQIRFQWDNATPVAPTVSFGEIMLNEGPIPQLFKLAGGDIQGEAAKAQRYFQRYDFAYSNGQVMGWCRAWASNEAYCTLPTTVPQRVNAISNVTLSGTGACRLVQYAADTYATIPMATYYSMQMNMSYSLSVVNGIDITGVSGLTVGMTYGLRGNDCTIAFNAEL